MTMHHLLLAALLAANSPATPVAVPQPDPAEEAVPEESPEARAYFEGLMGSMRRSQSARARAQAALTYAWGPLEHRDEQAHKELLRSAAQAAPADAMVQFAWATATPSAADCRDAAACREQRLAAARAEPDNGMAWLLALRTGQPEAEVDEILRRAADAERFDDHYVDAIEAWSKAYEAFPMSAGLASKTLAKSGELAWLRDGDPRALGRMLAIGQSVTFTFFGNGAYSFCNRKRQPDLSEARLQTCARLGRKIMQAGTTDMMVGTAGVAVVKSTGLATPGDLEAVRRYRWLTEQMGNSGGPTISAGEFNAYVDDLLSTRSEIRAQELFLTRLGVPVEPPAGWKPAYF
jgi:hypothetical protein